MRAANGWINERQPKNQRLHHIAAVCSCLRIIPSIYEQIPVWVDRVPFKSYQTTSTPDLCECDQFACPAQSNIGASKCRRQTEEIGGFGEVCTNSILLLDSCSFRLIAKCIRRLWRAKDNKDRDRSGKVI